MTDINFGDCVSKVFQSWTALQLAVSNSFGGPDSREKAEWFITATRDWFDENADLDLLEVEDFLSQIMSAEFETVVDDGSIEETSSLICRFYWLVKSNRTEEIKNLLSTLKPADNVTLCQRLSEPDSDDEDMDVSTSNLTSCMNNIEMNSTSGDNSQSRNSTSGDNSESHSGADNSLTDENGWTTVPNKNNRRKKH